MGVAAAKKEAISIHAPRKGERLIKIKDSTKEMLFQSTLPARGSDSCASLTIQRADISIHAPRKGERLQTEMTL